MKPLFLLLFFPSCLAFAIFLPALSLAFNAALPPHWSFSADVSLASPLPRNAYTAPSLSLFTPILSSPAFSSGKGFSLGFYSSFSSKATSHLPSSILLTVCLGTNQTDPHGLSFAVPVWHYDRTRPLQQLSNTGFISLSLNSSTKELSLRDGDGSVVFRMSNVEAMELQGNGNWVLYDANRRVVWQSFDHPSDTLLQGQYLGLGMRITSNNSLYIAEMKPGGLVFYGKSNAPAHLIYWAAPLNSSVVEYAEHSVFELSIRPPVNITGALEYAGCSSASSPGRLLPHPTPYALFQGVNLTVQGDCSSFNWPKFSNVFQNSSVQADFVMLADDGYPKGYTYIHNLGKNHLFTEQATSGYCLVPYTCGAYGICTESVLGLENSCHCPSASNNAEFENAFAYVDPSDPTQGCQRTVPLRCSDRSGIGDDEDSVILVEMKKSTFFSIHPVFEMTYLQNTFPLSDCVARCIHNCSCSGFFYHSGESFCLPFSDDESAGYVPSLTFISVLSPEFSSYVKLQRPKPVTMAAERSHSSSRLSMGVVLSIAMAIALSLLLAGVLAVFMYMKREKDAEDLEEQMEGGDDDLGGLLPVLPVRFSYKELYQITGGFSRKNLIGSGGFGCVYLGALPDGRKVAVKKLDQGSPRLKQFLAEVAIIRDVGHCNIASLRGFCSQKSHRLLVYDYMENGSLDRWLFSDREDSLLDWTRRFHIALGTASGLAYLHEECPRPIIHFDVKPQNILLDKDFEAKISDFGMCKLVGKTESSLVMTGVRGTPGYLAPEWLAHSTVGKKCDVYSYGMVLFEMVGGRKNAVQALVGMEQWYLPSWAAVLWKQGRIGEMVDRRLKGVYEEGEVRRMIHVAFLCIQRDPNLRPTMGCVCKMMEGSLVIKEEDPPFEQALDPLLSPFISPQNTLTSSPSYGSCTSGLLVGR